MKKQISCLISAAILSSAVAGFAAYEQTGDETMCFSGNAGVANTEVGIQVFISEKNTDDLATIKESGEGKYLDVLVYHDQVKTDSEGDYEFYIDLAKSGKYTAYIGYDDGTELSAEDFVFVDSQDYADVAEDINDMTASEIKGVIEGNPYTLGLSNEDLEDINISELASVIENTLNDTEFSESDRDLSWKIIDKALYVQQLNDGLINDVLAVDDSITGISKSVVADYIDAEYVTENLKKNFTERLNKSSFKSYSDYEDSILEAFVLATVQYPNGNDNIKNIVTAFEDELGVNVTSGTKESVWGKLAGGDYTLKEFQEDFEKYSKSSSESMGGGSGGGGGGSGSTGTKKPSGITEIMTTPENAQFEQMNPLIFDDIDNVEWAKTAIVYLTEKQILDGVGNNKFNPNGIVTREQLAKIVVSSFAKDAQAGANVFTDVDNNAWYAPFVLKAQSAGIVNGLGDGTFGVGRNITRQDMCVMIYNAAKAKGYNLESSPSTRKFGDDGQIADYAKDAVYALRECGAVNGVGAENFAPYGTATRAQVAKIIYYILETM